MKIQKILLIAVIAAFYSCSGDDSSSPVIVPPTGTPMVTKVTTDGADGENNDKTYLISYDGNKRIKEMKISGDVNKQMLFTYTGDGQLSTVSVTGSGAGLISFDYDAFKRLKSVFFNGSLGNVVYDPVADNYTSGSLTWSLNAHNDVRTFENTLFNYDFTQKSPFFNAASDYNFGAGFFVDPMLFYFGSKYMVNNWSINGIIVMQNNITISDGLVRKCIVSGQSNITANFEYSLL